MWHSLGRLHLKLDVYDSTCLRSAFSSNISGKCVCRPLKELQSILEDSRASLKSIVETEDEKSAWWQTYVNLTVCCLAHGPLSWTRLQPSSCSFMCKLECLSLFNSQARHVLIYSSRKALDARLEVLLAKIESDWLGEGKAMLFGSPQLADITTCIKLHVSAYVISSYILDT